MRRIIAAAILATVVQASVCLAQNTAVVTIGVKDESGAVVEGAEVSVVATNQKQAVPKVLRTDSKGITTLGLPPGTYDLSVKMTGFRRVTQQVVVTDAIHQTFAIGLRIEEDTCKTCVESPVTNVEQAPPSLAPERGNRLPNSATLAQPSTVAGTAITALRSECPTRPLH